MNFILFEPICNLNIANFLLQGCVDQTKDETIGEKDVEVQKSSRVQNQPASIRSTEEM